jgi:hypothetical protein
MQYNLTCQSIYFSTYLSLYMPICIFTYPPIICLYLYTVLEKEIQKCRYTFYKRNKDTPSEKWKQINIYVIYIDKCRHDIQEQKEVPLCYTGIYRPIPSTVSTYIYLSL